MLKEEIVASEIDEVVKKKKPVKKNKEVEEVEIIESENNE